MIGPPFFGRWEGEFQRHVGMGIVNTSKAKPRFLGKGRFGVWQGRATPGSRRNLQVLLVFHLWRLKVNFDSGPQGEIHHRYDPPKG